MFRRSLNPSTLAIALVMVFFMTITVRWSWNMGPSIIRSDAKGYYGYLRAIFITKDLGHERPDGTYLHELPEGTLNKYFAGEAVMLLPFFTGGHVVAHLTDAPLDGLSRPYQRAVSLAAWFYAFVGLMCFRAVLRRMGSGEWPAAGVILLLGFGTQLVQYVSIQPGWSHVYSFCAVSVFLLVTQLLAQGRSMRWALVWGALFGLICLIRPVNALVMLGVPVLLGPATGYFITRFLQQRGMALLAVLCGAFVLSVQSALWYAQVGHLVADGYRGEGFYWNRPAVFQVLFGVRRGLFVWAPVLFAAACAVLWLWKRDRYRAMAALVYWGANTYLISCWWIWFYGSGWGQRVYVDHYPVLFLPLALLLEQARGGWRWLLRGFMLLACALTMAQFYQFNHRLLHMECMDRAKYAYAFLKFDDAHRDRLGGNYRIAPFNPNGMDTLLHEKWDAETDGVHWRGRWIVWPDAPSAQHVVECPVETTYGPEFMVPANELPTGRELYLAVGFERHVYTEEESRTMMAVLAVEKPEGGQAFYEPFPMEPLPPRKPGQWEHIEYRIAIPALRPGEYIKFYFWNQQGNASFRADDLDVTLMAVRPY
jgi:hypothetical protein